jgi:hypothetical protein
MFLQNPSLESESLDAEQCLEHRYLGFYLCKIIEIEGDREPIYV